MSEERVVRRILIFNGLAVCCGAGMYLSYRYLENEHQFAVAIGLLGAVGGYFLAKASSVQLETQVEQIAGVAFIKEKQIEAESLEQLQLKYRDEIKNLQNTIIRESNRMLLTQLRTTRVAEIKEKMSECELITARLNSEFAEPVSPLLDEIRPQWQQMLSVAGPVPDDTAVVRTFLDAIPFAGQYLYLLYILLRHINPSIDNLFAAIIRRSIARAGFTQSDLPMIVKWLSYGAIGLVALIAFAIAKFL